MSDWVEIELPYPPTVNHYWKHTKQGRHYISKAGSEFKRTATAVCKQFKSFEGAVEIVMEVYFPDRRNRDLDNLPKGVFDSLVGAGLIKDDNNKIIKDYRVVGMNEIRKGGMVVVKVRELNGAKVGRGFGAI